MPVATSVGDAAVDLNRPAGTSRGLLMLGHGAGGGINASDLVTAMRTALEAQWAVARVLQPYRLAGRRAPAPTTQLDTAWLAVLGALRKQRGLSRVPLVVGGRSSGARVACRTAQPSGAAAVLALAFPLHPPGRPERSRASELADAGVPVVVVQGDRDAFGSATDIVGLQLEGVEVKTAGGCDHALRGAAATQVIADALASLLGSLSR